MLNNRTLVPAALAILVVAAILAGCDGYGGRDIPHANASKAESPSPPMMPSHPGAPGGRLVYNPKADEMLFVFDDLGTALTIPHLWQEGDVSIEKVAVVGATHSMCAYGARFHPVHEDPGSYYRVAVIRVYDEARWQALRHAGRVGEIELAHVDGKVYSFTSARTNPLPDGTAESERFDQLVISEQDAPKQLVIRKAS
ncbi:hypothetical protein [Luteibacter sp.]|uniref:hypothetical protein n=1 Tax=Luteibacter sp. TaxID=1886636 RepID=UPI00280A3D9D|nr:hypothetical protein [Luteibacter sp.]MDQ8051328.1 hypothetical protein [Luteibacter sp.]